MADVNRGNRPLSPHLQVYRPQMTSISSIFVRITGNALIVGALLVVWLLIALASGPDAYATANAVATSWLGKLIFLGSIWALWYHTLGGIRHLIWDTGRGLELETAEMMGWGLFIGSFVLTALTVLVL